MTCYVYLQIIHAYMAILQRESPDMCFILPCFLGNMALEKKFDWLFTKVITNVGMILISLKQSKDARRLSFFSQCKVWVIWLSDQTYFLTATCFVEIKELPSWDMYYFKLHRR